MKFINHDERQNIATLRFCAVASDLLDKEDREHDVPPKTSENDACFHRTKRQREWEDNKHAWWEMLACQESATGRWSEEVAAIYHRMAWFHSIRLLDETGDSLMSSCVACLVYLLQCLKILRELYGSEDARTKLVLDDLQDTVDEIPPDWVPNDLIPSIFHAWVLQEEAQTLQKQEMKRESRPLQSSEDLFALHLEALECLQGMSDGAIRSYVVALEEAEVYAELGRLAQMDHQYEWALSYFCQASIRASRWLGPQHPTTMLYQRQSEQSVSHITPYCTNQSTLENDPREEVRLPVLPSPRMVRESYSCSETDVRTQLAQKVPNACQSTPAKIVKMFACCQPSGITMRVTSE